MSIVEVSMAFLILGLTMLPMIELFSNAGREADQTSDHTLAAGLTAKVAEELRLGSWENPHFYKPVDADPTFGGEQDVVGGSSPFFATLEDTTAPLGRMLPGQDAGITPAFGKLYGDLKSFRMDVSAVGDMPPAAGSPVDIAVKVAWKDAKGKPQSSELRAVLPRLTQSGVQMSVNRVAADALIATQLYDEPATKTLAQIAAERGADLDLLRKLGDVVVIGLGMEETEEQYQADLKLLDTAASGASTSSSKARFLSLLAHRLESRATTRIHAIEYLASCVESLATSFDQAKMGNPPPAPATYVEALRLAAYLPLDFDWDLSDALSTHYTAITLPPDAMSPRLRTITLTKMVTDAQLMALTTGPDDLSYVQALLTCLESIHKGRNNEMEKYAVAERARSGDIATLRNTFPLPGRIAGFEMFKDNIANAVSKVIAAAPPLTAVPPATTAAAAAGGNGGQQPGTTPAANAAKTATTAAARADAAAAATAASVGVTAVDAAARKGTRAILAAARTGSAAAAAAAAADPYAAAAGVATAVSSGATPPTTP